MSDPTAPLFTVIMPVYNRARYVCEAVESVLGQTCRDWQLVVVDDNSTDESRPVVENLTRGDPRMVMALHRVCRGPGAARNTGLALARGRWIAYLDSDDRWLPHTLETYARYIADHPEAQFLYGHAHGLDANGKVTERHSGHQDRLTGTHELFEHVFLLPSASCHRRDLLARAGLFDEDLPTTEDYDLFLRMSLYCRFEPLNAVIALHRRHATSISRQTGAARLREGAILERFLARHGEQAAIEPSCVRRRLGRVYYAAARQYARSRDFRQARATIKRAHQFQRTFKSMALEAISICLGPLADWMGWSRGAGPAPR